MGRLLWFETLQPWSAMVFLQRVHRPQESVLCLMLCTTTCRIEKQPSSNVFFMWSARFPYAHCRQ